MNKRDIYRDRRIAQADHKRRLAKHLRSLAADSIGEIRESRIARAVELDNDADRLVHEEDT